MVPERHVSDGPGPDRCRHRGGGLWQCLDRRPGDGLAQSVCAACAGRADAAGDPGQPGLVLFCHQRFFVLGCLRGARRLSGGRLWPCFVGLADLFDHGGGD